MDVGGMWSGVVYFLILQCFSRVYSADISDFRLCGDPECKDPVSEGRTTSRYFSRGRGILSFEPNAQVIIYSKGAGKQNDLWGVEIEGKRGYAPKMFIQESKVHKKQLNFNVPTEPQSSESPDTLPSEKNAENEIKSSNPDSAQGDSPMPSKVEEENVNKMNDNANSESEDKNKLENDADIEQEKKDIKKLTIDDLNQYLIKPGGLNGYSEFEVTPSTTSTEVKEEQKTPDDTTQEEASEPILREEVHQPTTASKPSTLHPALSSSMSFEELINSNAPSSTNMNVLSDSPTSELENVGTVPSTMQHANNEPPASSFPSTSTSLKSEPDSPALDASAKTTDRFTVIEGTTLPADDDNDEMYGLDGSSTPDTVIEKIYDESNIQVLNSPYPSTTSPSVPVDEKSVASFTLHSSQDKLNNAKAENYDSSSSIKTEQNEQDNAKELKLSSKQEAKASDEMGSSSVSDIIGESKPFVSSFFGEQGSEGVPRTIKNNVDSNNYLKETEQNALSDKIENDKKSDNFKIEKINSEPNGQINQGEVDKPEVETSQVSGDESKENDKNLASVTKNEKKSEQHINSLDNFKDKVPFEENGQAKIKDLPIGHESIVKNNYPDGMGEKDKNLASDTKNEKDSDQHIDSSDNFKNKVPFEETNQAKIEDLPSDNINIEENKNPDSTGEVTSEHKEDSHLYTTTKYIKSSLSENVQLPSMTEEMVPHSYSPSQLTEQPIFHDLNLKSSYSNIINPSGFGGACDHMISTEVPSSTNNIATAQSLIQDIPSELNYNTQSHNDNFHSNKKSVSDAAFEENTVNQYDKFEKGEQNIKTEDDNGYFNKVSQFNGGVNDGTYDKIHHNALEQSNMADTNLLSNGNPESDLHSEPEIFSSKIYLNEESAIHKESENTQSGDENMLDALENYISALRTCMQTTIDMLPEPLYTAVVDLEKQGLSPRVTVFLVIASASSIFLIISIFLIKKTSKEKSLLIKLSAVEQKLFTTITEKNVHKDELETAKQQILNLEQHKSEQQSLLKPLQEEFEKCKLENSQMCTTIEELHQELDIQKHSYKEVCLKLQSVDEENVLLQQKLEESEKASNALDEEFQKVRMELEETEEQKEQLTKSEKELKGCITQLEQTCSQLLQEAEVWNDRVKELTSQIENDKKNYTQLQESSKNKDVEIEGLKETLKEMQVIQQLSEQDPEEAQVEKKIEQLLDATLVRQELQVSQKENTLLNEKLETEKQRVTNLEIELLESTSEVEKLKSNYNLALQDKTEAQTKLDVLSNYFKEKEVQLQKELGVQEAMRQQKEDDASSASRRVALIEQENSSYKYQVASVKQELEETERNFRNQIAAQEKRAHENWLAARAAERKLEEAKQEMSQLRQRLTLLEREQEAWAKSQPDGIVRPIPKRYLGPNGEVPFSSGQILSQEMGEDADRPPSTAASLPSDMLDSSKAGRPPLPPMMLPPDRPLPPPPLHPLDRRIPHIPPFLPHVDARFPPPPFGIEPWRLPPPGMLLNSGPPSYHSFERRMSPSEYERGRLSTPPRVRQASPPYERDVDRHSSSPREQQSRDSRSSSPPHPLPRFHDIPPPRPFGYSFPPPPPPLGRFPPFPPRRREPFPPGPPEYRPDSRGGDMAPGAPRESRHSPPPDSRTSNAAMDV